MRAVLRSIPALALILLLSACSGSGEKKKNNDDEDPSPSTESAAEPGHKEAASSSAPAAPRSLVEVEKAFDARKEAFRRVNSARLSQNAGSFNVTLTFAASGEVVECRMLSTDFRDDPAFNAAVMAEVWRVRIAPRAGAGEFVVTSYPITFSARSEAIATPPSMPVEPLPTEPRP